MKLLKDVERTLPSSVGYRVTIAKDAARAIKNRGATETNGEIKRIVLYGSTARGEGIDGISDIDLVVIYDDTGDLAAHSSLIQELAERGFAVLGLSDGGRANKIDLRIYRESKVCKDRGRLFQNIRNEGIVL